MKTTQPDLRSNAGDKDHRRIASVTLVIPALNEADAITQTVNAIPVAEMQRAGFTTQVLVVDNGSDDGTGDLATKAGATVVREPRRGYGNALAAGFHNAQGDVIVTVDADLTYPTADIPALVTMLRDEDLDFINTNRFPRMAPGAMSARNRVGNGVLSVASKLLYGLPFSDSQSGMWIFRRDILSRMKLRSTGMAFSEELKIEAAFYCGLRVKEVPIIYRQRVGQVKLRAIQDGLYNLRFLVAKRLAR